MKIRNSDLLLVIDVQNDFCPGGALAVTDGGEIVSGINKLMKQFHNVILTQDWHPTGHSSFASSHTDQTPFSMIDMPYGPQTLWPDHCVQGTKGAEFHAELNTDRAQAIVRKGTRIGIDSYSAFVENDKTTSTGLIGMVKDLGIKRIFLVGLATDYCVAYSALDSANFGLETFVIDDLCRAIDLDGSLDAAYANFIAAKIGRIAMDDLNF